VDEAVGCGAPGEVECIGLFADDEQLSLLSLKLPKHFLVWFQYMCNITRDFEAPFRRRVIV
jgi:hypothetical protein